MEIIRSETETNETKKKVKRKKNYARFETRSKRCQNGKVKDAEKICNLDFDGAKKEVWFG